ncbi:hypothetical protein HYT58_02180 [Candidatus Woesearchaeota archaeon]|nr:hypothetical protein [Candidatus Woesearchaeota archaeon]
MPHQCVRCGNMYEDASKEILKGCNCGGKFFFFIKKESMQQMQEITSQLTEDDKKQMEQDAFELIGEEETEKPVVLDLESIRMLKPGKFEIDLVDLFKGAPLVYKLDEGRYIIDVATTFKSLSKKK